MPRYFRAVLLWGMVVAGIAGLLAIPSPLPSTATAIDFRGYWSTSYLLLARENFADPVRLFQVERELTGWWKEYPMVAWNPPWLGALLLPFAIIPFTRAAWWWLLFSIALIFASGVLLWRLDAPRDLAKQNWVAALTCFIFVPTLVALIAGQVNVLVFFGLTGLLWFSARQRKASAGMCLALTTVKPQLVYVTVPIILLEWIRARRWRCLTGFFSSLIGLTLIVFALRPTFLFDYFATMGAGDLLAWETPTLGGWLDFQFGWRWAKLSGVVVLPLAIFIWSRTRGMDERTLVDVTLMLSVITAPFGWSYDFVVLLVPLIRIMVWIFGMNRVESIVLGFGLVGMELVMLYQRVSSPSEVFYVWVPWTIAALYTFAWWRQSQSRNAYA